LRFLQVCKTVFCKSVYIFLKEIVVFNEILLIFKIFYSSSFDNLSRFKIPAKVFNGWPLQNPFRPFRKWLYPASYTSHSPKTESWGQVYELLLNFTT